MRKMAEMKGQKLVFIPKAIIFNDHSEAPWHARIAWVFFQLEADAHGYSPHVLSSRMKLSQNYSTKECVR